MYRKLMCIREYSFEYCKQKQKQMRLTIRVDE